jgi:hypothetical protein
MKPEENNLRASFYLNSWPPKGMLPLLQLRRYINAYSAHARPIQWKYTDTSRRRQR